MSVLGSMVLGQSVLGQPEPTSTPGSGAVTLTEIKTHLNITATRYDDELQVMLDDVLGILEAETGRPLAVRDIVQAGEACMSRMVLHAVPCPCSTCAPHVTMQVLGLVVDGSPVDVVDRRLDGPVLSWCRTSAGSASTYADRGAVATYRAGYASTPPWLRLATKRLVEHLWQRTQQAPHPALSQVGGGYDEAAPSTASYLLPYAVMSLIERHRALV